MSNPDLGGFREVREGRPYFIPQLAMVHDPEEAEDRIRNSIENERSGRVVNTLPDETLAEDYIWYGEGTDIPVFYMLKTVGGSALLMASVLPVIAPQEGMTGPLVMRHISRIYKASHDTVGGIFPSARRLRGLFDSPEFGDDRNIGPPISEYTWTKGCLFDSIGRAITFTNSMVKKGGSEYRAKRQKV